MSEERNQNQGSRRNQAPKADAGTLAQSLTKRKVALKKPGVEAEPQKKRVRKSTDQFTGRRKTAVARVWVRPGTGKFIINDLEIEKYFPRKDLQIAVKKPLLVSEKENQFDVFASVMGGGIAGQAHAVSLGLARSIDSSDSTVHSKLKAAGLLKRDPRMVERKKYGLHKARRATQFSKR